MKYTLNMRAVADLNQSIESKHASFVDLTRDLPAPWAPDESVPPPYAGSQLVARIAVRKLFGNPLRGDLVYQYRRPFDPEFNEDDYLWMDFNPKRVDLSLLIHKVLPVYIRAFNAYFLEVADDLNLLARFDQKKEMNFTYREHVDELAPVTYVRNWLCESAFGINCSELLVRLEGQVEGLIKVDDGVLVIVTSKLLPAGESRALCKQATSRALRK